MPRLLPVTERNDVATVTFNDSLNLAGVTIQGVARAGTSSTGVGAWFSGTYGALLVNANGTYSYRLDNEDPGTNALAAGLRADDRFTITYSLGGVTHTDATAIRVTGIDEPGQQVATGTQPLQFYQDTVIGALQQINISATAIRSDGKKYMPDVIADIASGSDKIDLGAIDANADTGTNDAFTFIGTGAFSNQAGQLRAVTANGVTSVFADVDGDGSADLHIILATPVTLTAADFIL